MNMSSKEQLYRIGDPEDDLFSDAMDRAVSAQHSYKHGLMRNAECGGALAVDGEKIARRGIAIAIKAYLEELRPAVETTRDAGDAPCTEADGCPTEMAVLKRYWRASHALLPPQSPAGHGPAVKTSAERA